VDTAYAEQLVRRQDALQAEASRVIAELDLMGLLARAGHAGQVGSLVSGLMVWRDIDVCVVSPGLSVDRTWEVMQPIVARREITRVSFANESGHLNTSGRPNDDRHYFVIHYETAAHDDWKIDITFWLTRWPAPATRSRGCVDPPLARKTSLHSLAQRCVASIADLPV